MIIQGHLYILNLGTLNLQEEKQKLSFENQTTTGLFSVFLIIAKI